MIVLVLSLSWAATPAHPVAAAPQPPQLLPWEQQAPYPTRFAINGVDMVSPTEAWAVAYTDILHTTDGGATWEKQPRPGNDNLYSVDFFDNQHGIAFGNTVLYTTNGGATWNQGSTVLEGTDEISQRKRRATILRSLLESLFARKDAERLFSIEQRRILWNSTAKRVCGACGKALTWEDFAADHINPHSKGGRTTLDNAAVMHRRCNSAKGNRRLRGVA